MPIPKVVGRDRIFLILFVVFYLVFFFPKAPVYMTSYVPGPGGIPLFWCFWTVMNVIVLVTAGIWVHLKNKEEEGK